MSYTVEGLTELLDECRRFPASKGARSAFIAYATNLAAALAQPNIPPAADMAKIEQDCLSFAALSCIGPIKQAYRLFYAQGKTEEDFDKCAWDAMSKAVKEAVQLTAREVRDPVWPYLAAVPSPAPQGT